MNEKYYLEKQPRYGCFLSLLLQEMRFEFEWHQDDVDSQRVLFRGDKRVAIIFSDKNERGFLCVDSIEITRGDITVSLDWEDELSPLSRFQIRKQLVFWIDEPIVKPKIW